jgi:V/A-type H+-transporting ATPase subunit I
MILSISTIIWGFLNGTYFAIPAKYLPEWMRGLDWFTDPSLKNKHVQQLCFMIAAIHLSLGHIWKAILYINSRKALSEIGWAMLITGNYFTALNLIVYPGHPPPQTLLMALYGGGFILTALFAVDWRKIGDIFNYPFGLIGTFVDLLSYIRLFAVGLSSYYIAKSFNDMGLMVFDISDQPTAKILLAVGMTFVIVIGHILNIILAFLGVLVHGIRLNTLEFSNHMALQWLGYVYQPFAKKTEKTADTETPEPDSAQVQPA